MPEQPVDAVLTATALHWLSESTVRRLYTDLARLIRPGGVFAHAEVMPMVDLPILGIGLARVARERRNADLPDGRSIQIVNQPLPDGGWVATHEDVTEKRRADARIAYIAHHDTLTGLSNRAAIAQAIEDAAARQRRDCL